MLSNIGWISLESRRKEARLCQMYKIFHGQMNVDVSSILCQPTYVGRNDHQKKVMRLQSRTLCYHNSFFPKTIREWNGLAADTMGAESLQEFKKAMEAKRVHNSM